MLLLLPERTACRLAECLDTFPWIGHSLAELWRAVWMYRNQWRSVLAALLLSLVSHCGFVLTFYFCAKTFLDSNLPDQIPSLAEHFLIVPLGMTWQGIFPSPGGVGGGEAGFAFLYNMVGKQAFRGGVAAFTERLIMLTLSMIGYLVYLRLRAEVASIQKQTEVDEAGELAEADTCPPPVLAPASSDLEGVPAGNPLVAES
jgi:hypothetical protein